MVVVILFSIGYFGFLVVYPILQIWTLVRDEAVKAQEQHA